MKNILVFVLAIISINIFGQKSLTEIAQPIVEEGKLLYRSEMASWYGTDLFLENYKERENIGGYFSYSELEVSKCIFYSNSDFPKVLATISFDSTYNLKLAKIDLVERDFSRMENDLYLIRKAALAEINSDTLFVRYNNTNLNLIPLIKGEEKKVFVLTGPQQHGVVLFGNDYLLEFDENNALLSKRSLHKNLIPITYGDKLEGEWEAESAIHSHLPDTGDFITSTDICTIMLYEKFAGWKSHHVVSESYLNIWNCETDKLIVIRKDAFDKILDDQKKDNEKEDNPKKND